MENQYQIRWISKITGAPGFGTATFPKEQAEMIADTLNGKPGVICTHQAVSYNKANATDPKSRVDIEGSRPTN